MPITPCGSPTRRSTRVASSRGLIDSMLVRKPQQLLLGAALSCLLLAGCSGVNTQRDVVDNGTSGTPSSQQLPPGPTFVVGMGDSYMSGEAGQWATNTTTWTTNAGWDVGTPAAVYGKTQLSGPGPYTGCHRAASAPMNYPSSSQLQSINLACSGAITNTVPQAGVTPTLFKPGIDFYPSNGPVDRPNPSADSEGVGQAQLLYEAAKAHRVSIITLSIGGNDAGFADVIQSCLQNFVLFKYCKDEKANTDRISPEALDALSAKAKGAVDNIETAMSAAGYRASDYKVVYQLPPAPLPQSKDIRYAERTNRQTTGGCGFYNADIDWLLDSYGSALRSAFTSGAQYASADGALNLVVVDNTELFAGHRLCEDKANRTGDGTGNPPPTKSPDTFTTTEWVRGISITQAVGPTTDQSTAAMHPMYWGQRALAACAARASAAMPANPSFTKVTCGLDGPARLVDGVPAVKVTGSSG